VFLCPVAIGFVDLDPQKIKRKKIQFLKSSDSSFGGRLLLELESPSWGLEEICCIF
jgi:hypothetical protein